MKARPWAKGCGWPYSWGKGHNDSPQSSREETQPRSHPDFRSVRHVLAFWPTVIMHLCCLKLPGFVVMCYHSNEKPTRYCEENSIGRWYRKGWWWGVATPARDDGKPSRGEACWGWQRTTQGKVVTWGLKGIPGSLETDGMVRDAHLQQRGHAGQGGKWGRKSKQAKVLEALGGPRTVFVFILNFVWRGFCRNWHNFICILNPIPGGSDWLGSRRGLRTWICANSPEADAGGLVITLWQALLWFPYLFWDCFSASRTPVFSPLSSSQTVSQNTLSSQDHRTFFRSLPCCSWSLWTFNDAYIMETRLFLYF